jgi:very-short-patch-repair endonuclease
VDELRRGCGINRQDRPVEIVEQPVETLPDLLARLGGRAGFAQLTRTIPKRELAEAVRSGAVVRLAKGVYGLPGPSTARRVAIAYDGTVSHLSAAVAWELPLLAAPEKPHITVPRKRRPRPGPPAVLHWAPVEPRDQRRRLTSLLRTVLDCSRILPFGQALAVADAGLARRLNRPLLLATTEAMRGPGSKNAREVAAAATGASESFLESMLRALVIQAGLEGFEPQVLVERGKFRARVDLGHRQTEIAVEAEGYEFHGSSRDFAADCRRYDELVAAGWLVLRFTYHQVVFEPEWVIATIREALRQRGFVPIDRQ